MNPNNRNQRRETIIPEDLSYLPGGDNQSASDSSLGRTRNWSPIISLVMFFLRPALKLLIVSFIPTLLLVGLGWWMLSNFSGVNLLPLNLPDNVNVAEWTERAKQTTQDFFAKLSTQFPEAKSSELPTTPKIENRINVSDTSTILLTPQQDK